MAVVKLNPLIAEVYGKIGDLVFKRGPNGQTIVSKMPGRSQSYIRRIITMAIAKLDPLFTEVHGKIGDLVFRRGPHGQTIISKMPRRSLWKVKKVRKIQKKRMLEAHAQARAAMADPDLRAYYEQEAKKTGKRAYSLALTDALQSLS